MPEEHFTINNETNEYKLADLDGIIEQLAITDPIVCATMQFHKQGSISYVDALRLAVIELSRSRTSLVKHFVASMEKFGVEVRVDCELKLKDKTEPAPVDGKPCPFVHDDIHTIFGVEPCLVEDLPKICTCGRLLTYADKVVFVSAPKATFECEEDAKLAAEICEREEVK